MKNEITMTYKEAVAFCKKEKIEPKSSVLTALIGVHRIICRKCLEDKKVNQFYRDDATRTGRKSVCIACGQSDAQREKTLLREKRSAYGCSIEQDPVVILAYQKKQYEKHGYYQSAVMKWEK